MHPWKLVDRRQLARGGLLLAVLLVAIPRAGHLGGSSLLAEETVIETPATDSTSQDEASGLSRRDALIASVTIFVLAVFVGFEVITKVPPTLHTPLMSGSNAISGITLVGALLATGVVVEGGSQLLPVLGTLAVVMATINVVGGFLVTHRMLSMFRRK
jgi:NAD(P) transhydrogenase subunit alpha